MKSIRVMTTAILAVFLLTGCLYLHVKTPYDTDLDKTVLGEKVGKANIYSVLWLFAWGDAGTEAAAKNGDITTINHMDREVFSILFGLYSKTTTIVYGD
jgi:TRL-like protein family